MVMVQEFQDGELVAEYDDGHPEPDLTRPVDADTVIASVAAMTAEQKAELRAALGL